MTDQADPNDGPPWIAGDMMFRLAGDGASTDRLVRIDRPFALVGRSRAADLVIPDRTASVNHAYLHLDPRGVHVVDLVTRNGTRINGVDQGSGWLRPGDRLEVAGRRIELIRIRIDGQVIDPPPCSADLLADTDRPDLPAVTLEPLRSSEPPWIVNSELIFLGWSASCGIQIRDPAVARTHCALVRTVSGAWLVDLGGQQTWIEDRPVRRASALRDGDMITLGSTQFTVRIGPAARSRPSPARPTAPAPTIVTPTPEHHPAAITPDLLPAFPTPQRLAPPAELVPWGAAHDGGGHALVPAEARDSLLAWMLGAIQGSQRQQGEFQIAVTEALRQIQQDSAAMLSAQLSRIEATDRELAALRAELQRRNAAPPPPTLPAPPAVEPLKIPRPTAPAPAEAAGPSPESRASTAWILERVGQLEAENKSAWKDLLGRLSQSKKST